MSLHQIIKPKKRDMSKLLLMSRFYTLFFCFRKDFGMYTQKGSLSIYSPVIAYALERDPPQTYRNSQTPHFLLYFSRLR